MARDYEPRNFFRDKGLDPVVVANWAGITSRQLYNWYRNPKRRTVVLRLARGFILEKHFGSQIDD